MACMRLIYGLNIGVTLLRFLIMPMFCLSMPHSMDRFNQFGSFNFNRGRQRVPSHCSKISSIVATLDEKNLDATAEVLMKTVISADLGLKQTACFQVYFNDAEPTSAQSPTNHVWSHKLASAYNGSLIFSVTFLKLEQLHPIRNEYVFAVPQLSADCVCDCPGGDDVCSSARKFQNCSSANSLPRDLCYHTFHPHQAAVGCPFDGEAEICCKVKVKPDPHHPYYQAFYVDQPTTQALVSYSIYRADPQSPHQSIQLLGTKTFRLSINKPSQQTTSVAKQQLHIRIHGHEPSRRLAEGTYFVPLNHNSSLQNAPLLRSLAINNKGEWDMYRLGWFRRREESFGDTGFSLLTPDWHIRNGPVKVQDIHHVTAIDCKGQRYSDLYDAEFYTTDVLRWETPIGQKVTDYYPWLASANYDRGSADTTSTLRQVRVEHAFSPSISVRVELAGDPQVILNYHESVLGDFTGVIRLDKHSNYYLNATFTRTKGSVIGALYTDRGRESVDAVLSAYVGSNPLTSLPAENTSLILELPAGYDRPGPRWACFYPAQRPSLEICKLVSFSASPLQWFVLPSDRWEEAEGDCPGCNELSATNFLKYLNPKTWLDGISSTPEALAMAFEIAFYGLLALVVGCLLRKCIVPLVNWSVCSGGGCFGSPEKVSKKKNKGSRTSRTFLTGKPDKC